MRTKRSTERRPSGIARSSTGPIRPGQPEPDLPQARLKAQKPVGEPVGQKTEGHQANEHGLDTRGQQSVRPELAVRGGVLAMRWIPKRRRLGCAPSRSG